jgi:hypothetical protein
MAILHSAMTALVPNTLHHKAHVNHQRHLQSISATEQSTSALLDSMRTSIDRECNFPVLYTGCSAAQCVCLSATHLVLVSLQPTIPLSASKNVINISSVVSARFVIT